MRLFKKTAALVMVFMMLVTAMSSFTLASANAVVDKFEVKEFSVLNSTGGNTLAAGDVTVNVTLQRVKGLNNTEDAASVIAAVYSNDALVDVAASKKAYPFAGTTQVNELSLTIPTGTTNPELRVFLWNGDMITPISKPSDEAKVTGIKLGGVEVAGFDAATTTYNVTLPAGTSDEPAVKVTATGLIDADVAYNTDKTSATITVGANVYTVNYTITQIVGALTNVSYWDENIDTTYTVGTEASNLELGTVRPNLDASLFYDEATGDYTKTINNVYGVGVYNGLADYVTPTLNGRDPYWFYMDLPEKFVGMNYIMAPYTNPGAVYSSQDTITFTTNKSVRFYIASPSSWVSDGAVFDGAYTFNQVRMGDSNATTTSYKDLKSTSTGANYTFTSNVYKYEIIVPEGETSATATLRVQTAGTWDVPHIFYEFIDTPATEPVVNLTNVSYTSDSTYTETTASNPVKLGTVKPNLNAEDFYDESTQGYTKNLRDALGVSSLADMSNYVTPIVSNRYPYWFYMDMPEKFVGMQYIMVPYNTDTVYAGYDTITFTTDRSVRFYVSAPSAWIDDGAVLDGTYTFKYTAPGDSVSLTTSYADLYAMTTAAEKSHTNDVYVYDIIVPEGETSATATLKVRSAGTWDFPHIFYEAIE
ncbi:MAG: hypothetical protein IJN62_06025 [Clostridia bacterium]|nr:hypothetical protein [Clostridia bacterium]